VEQNRFYPVFIFLTYRIRFADCINSDRVCGSDAATVSCLKLGDTSCCKMEVAYEQIYGKMLA
jgi:hypothetical protein